MDLSKMDFKKEFQKEINKENYKNYEKMKPLIESFIKRKLELFKLELLNEFELVPKEQEEIVM